MMTNPTGDAAKDLGDKVLPQADVANEDEGRHAQCELNDNSDIGKFVRFNYPGHRYHGMVGRIISGTLDCCILHFAEINRDFGPCGPRNGETLEVITPENSHE